MVIETRDKLPKKALPGFPAVERVGVVAQQECELFLGLPLDSHFNGCTEAPQQGGHRLLINLREDKRLLRLFQQQHCAGSQIRAISLAPSPIPQLHQLPFARVQIPRICALPTQSNVAWPSL